MRGVDHASSRIYKASFKTDRSYAGEYVLKFGFSVLMTIFMELGCWSFDLLLSVSWFLCLNLLLVTGNNC